MAVLEEAVEGLLEGGAVTGVAIGAGALLLFPGLRQAVGRVMRPLAVGAIKAGMVVYDQAGSTLREATEDLVAEARAELEAEGREVRAEPERRRGRGAEAHA